MADPPNSNIIGFAHSFIITCKNHNLFPVKVSPSVVGGIGITFKNMNNKKVYFEVYNNYEMISMFTDGSDEIIIRKVRNGLLLIGQIKTYLNIKD